MIIDQQGGLILSPYFSRFLLIFIFAFINLVAPAYASARYPVRYHKVIIIGAGVAGLETARYLQDHHVKDFIILEARHRIGGRAWTVSPKGKWHNAHLDLGAQWIHGATPENPLTQLAYRYHLATEPSDLESVVVYNANGIEVPDATQNNYDDLYNQYDTFFKYLQESGSTYANLSVSDAVLAFIHAHHLNKEQQKGLLYLVSSHVEQEYAADITRLSLPWFNSDDAFRGPERVLKKGYIGIVNGLASGLKNKIRLGQIITKINYQNPKNIIVKTQSGATYHADFVVCTLPVGVLQRNAVRFTPKLPKDKQIAIHKHIGVGLLNKVIMLFPRAFWDKSQFIERVPNAYWSGRHWINKGQWIEFDNINYYQHRPILTALVSGNFARGLEKQSDQKIIQSAMRILRHIYGRNIPNPVAHIVTRWGTDPYAGGAYVSLKPGALADGKDYLALGRPLAHGHLLFAGAGTTALYPATIHGAYLTGKRAAKFIKNYPHDFWSSDIDSALDNVGINTLFLSNTVFANYKDEVMLQVFPTMTRGVSENQNYYTTELNYGATDRLTMSLFWDAYTLVMPISSGDPKTRGPGDFGIGAQYLLESFKHPYTKGALGIDVTFPVADINKDLTNGFLVYQPYILFQQGFPALANLQFFNEFSFDLVDRIQEPAPDEDGVVSLVPAAHSFIWNAGFYLPTQHFRFIAQINWNTNEWNNGGQKNQLFISPGIIFIPARSFEMGISVPIGLNRKTDKYQVIGYLGLILD